MASSQASTAAGLIQSLRATRAHTLDRLSICDPAELNAPRQWHGGRSDLRFCLNWLSEGSENRRIRILSTGRLLSRPRMTDAQHALGIAAAARGRLLGHLIGVSDRLFERQPADGEWSIRQIMGHVIAVDERYRIAVEHAVARARSGGAGPERPDEASLPARTGESMSGGTPAEVLGRAQTVHDTLLSSLGTIPDDLLGAPTNWAGRDVDLRFRLHRFAAHDREHTIQIRKALRALGFDPNEPQLLLADAQAELGALVATLIAIGDAYLDRRPASGPTIAALVEECLTDERDI